MITLIGTPPNIVIAKFRGDALGEPYRMFDFAPVGLACAIVGLLYVTLIGWRLLPADRRTSDAGKALFDLANYIAEVRVPKESTAIGKRALELEEEAAKVDVQIVGLIRHGQRMGHFGRNMEIKAGDILVVEARPEQIEELIGALNVEYVSAGTDALAAEELTLVEAVVPELSPLAGRTSQSMRLLYRYGVALVGVSREGQPFRERVRGLNLRAGDVLLLLGSEERINDAINRLKCLPLKDRGQRVIQRDKAWLAVGIFALAIGLAATGVIYLSVALGCVVAAMAFTNIVPLRDVYDSIEWPVIVLLGSMIPIGSALQATGGTELIASGLVTVSDGFSPAVVLTLLIVVTMTLSDVMNNTATAVIAAPIAVEIADQLGVNPDPFLMGVAVAASCAFLTPIGHKNNTLIMGPGGYHFGDYWRMGLPLEILIIVVSVPAILFFWPL